MNTNPLSLGVDIRQNSLIISGVYENQKELINETYGLLKDRDVEELIDAIRAFSEKYFEGADIDYLIYSCKGYPLPKCRKLERAFREQGFGKAGIRLLTHENAFVHYVMKQKEELHRHTVIGFDFDGREMTAYRLFYPNRKNKKEMKGVKYEVLLLGKNNIVFLI